MIIGKNTLAVRDLKRHGYPIQNIRKSLHKLTGIGQPLMAEKIGTTRQNVTHHINGHSKNPETQAKIAAIWQVPVDELFPNDKP